MISFKELRSVDSNLDEIKSSFVCLTNKVEVLAERIGKIESDFYLTNQEAKRSMRE